MSYEQFVENIKKNIESQAGDDLQISIHQAVKNNGYRRKGITFREKGNHISPTIYLEEYYEKHKLGCEVEALADQVLKMYRRVRLEEFCLCEPVRDYESVQDRIIYKLVNREKNRELLKEVPHVEYLDLAILFYVLVNLDSEGECMTTMLVRNEHMNLWRVTTEELYQKGAANTEKLLPYEFSALSRVIKEMLENQEVKEKEEEEIPERESMYVLTNSIRNSGAAAILYPGRLEMLGICLEENYYILPSSIHEVIVIPESRALSGKELESIVREVNETHVREEEVLSDHVYLYHREEKRLSIQ